MVLGLLAGAPVAHAGTVALSNPEHCECDEEGGPDQLTHTLVWTGAAGEANTVEVSFTANAFRVTDTTAPLTAGDGCRQVSAGEASCTTPATCPGGRGISCF